MVNDTHSQMERMEPCAPQTSCKTVEKEGLSNFAEASQPNSLHWDPDDYQGMAGFFSVWIKKSFRFMYDLNHCKIFLGEYKESNEDLSEPSQKKTRCE